MLKSKLNNLTLRTKLKTDKMSKNRFYQVQNYQVYCKNPFCVRLDVTVNVQVYFYRSVSVLAPPECFILVQLEYLQGSFIDVSFLPKSYPDMIYHRAG